MTEAEYDEYIKMFNEACAGDGSGFAAFFDRYYEPDAVFKYIPRAAKNSGRDDILKFWLSVHGAMKETIRPDISFSKVGRTMASEMPINFYCNRDVEWEGAQHKQGTKFRLMVAAFYDLSPNEK